LFETFFLFQDAGVAALKTCIAFLMNEPHAATAMPHPEKTS